MFWTGRKELRNFLKSLTENIKAPRGTERDDAERFSFVSGGIL